MLRHSGQPPRWLASWPVRAPRTGVREHADVARRHVVRWAQRHPDEAFDQVPEGAPRLVMMYHPASYPETEEGRAPLAVAGHTHCGQIALPGTPTWSYLQLRADEQVVVDGFAPVGYGADGNRLFTTCGIGSGLVPMRIWAPPQLAVFELVPGAPRSSPSQ